MILFKGLFLTQHCCCWWVYFMNIHLDSKAHGANIGPIWGRQDPGGPHVGPMNFAIWAPKDHCRSNLTIFTDLLSLCLVIYTVMKCELIAVPYGYGMPKQTLKIAWPWCDWSHDILFHFTDQKNAILIWSWIFLMIVRKSTNMYKCGLVYM